MTDRSNDSAVLGSQRRADTPGAKFVASVQGVVRVSEEPVIRVVDSGLSNALSIDDTTRFRVGSLSKVFTAIGVLKLVQQGALSLDEELTKTIPEFTIGNDFSETSRAQRARKAKPERVTNSAKRDNQYLAELSYGRDRIDEAKRTSKVRRDVAANPKKKAKPPIPPG